MRQVWLYFVLSVACVAQEFPTNENVYVPDSRTITGTNGITGGGDLTTNRVLSIDATIVATNGSFRIIPGANITLNGGTSTVTVQNAQSVTIAATSPTTNTVLARTVLTTNTFLSVATAIQTANAPNITEGTQLFSTTYTPLASNSFLRVNAIVHFGAEGGQARPIAALFVGADTNSVSVSYGNVDDVNSMSTITLLHPKYPVTNTAALAFSLRVGKGGANDIDVNGTGGAGLFGGKLVSSLEIVELNQ